MFEKNDSVWFIKSQSYSNEWSLPLASNGKNKPWVVALSFKPFAIKLPSKSITKKFLVNAYKVGLIAGVSSSQSPTPAREPTSVLNTMG